MGKAFLRAYNFMSIVGATLCCVGIVIGILSGIISAIDYLIAMIICVLFIMFLNVIIILKNKEANKRLINKMVIIRGHLSVLFGASALLFSLMYNQGNTIMQALTYVIVIGIFMIVMTVFMLKAFDKLFENMEG